METHLFLHKASLFSLSHYLVYYSLSYAWLAALTYYSCQDQTECYFSLPDELACLLSPDET